MNENAICSDSMICLSYDQGIISTNICQGGFMFISL